MPPQPAVSTRRSQRLAQKAEALLRRPDATNNAVSGSSMGKKGKKRKKRKTMPPQESSMDIEHERGNSEEVHSHPPGPSPQNDPKELNQAEAARSGEPLVSATPEVEAQAPVAQAPSGSAGPSNIADSPSKRKRRRDNAKANRRKAKEAEAATRRSEEGTNLNERLVPLSILPTSSTSPDTHAHRAESPEDITSESHLPVCPNSPISPTTYARRRAEIRNGKRRVDHPAMPSESHSPVRPSSPMSPTTYARHRAEIRNGKRRAKHPDDFILYESRSPLSEDDGFPTHENVLEQIALLNQTEHASSGGSIPERNITHSLSKRRRDSSGSSESDAEDSHPRKKILANDGSVIPAKLQKAMHAILGIIYNVSLLNNTPLTIQEPQKNIPVKSSTENTLQISHQASSTSSSGSQQQSGASAHSRLDPPAIDDLGSSNPPVISSQHTHASPTRNTPNPPGVGSRGDANAFPARNTPDPAVTDDSTIPARDIAGPPSISPQEHSSASPARNTPDSPKFDSQEHSNASPIRNTPNLPVTDSQEHTNSLSPIHDPSNPSVAGSQGHANVSPTRETPNPLAIDDSDTLPPSTISNASPHPDPPTTSSQEDVNATLTRNTLDPPAVTSASPIHDTPNSSIEGSQERANTSPGHDTLDPLVINSSASSSAQNTPDLPIQVPIDGPNLHEYNSTSLVRDARDTLDPPIYETTIPSNVSSDANLRGGPRGGHKQFGLANGNDQPHQHTQPINQVIIAPRLPDPGLHPDPPLLPLPMEVDRLLKRGHVEFGNIPYKKKRIGPMTEDERLRIENREQELELQAQKDDAKRERRRRKTQNRRRRKKEQRKADAGSVRSERNALRLAERVEVVPRLPLIGIEANSLPPTAPAATPVLRPVTQVSGTSASPTIVPDSFILTEETSSHATPSMTASVAPTPVIPLVVQSSSVEASSVASAPPPAVGSSAVVGPTATSPSIDSVQPTMPINSLISVSPPLTVGPIAAVPNIYEDEIDVDGRRGEETLIHEFIGIHSPGTADISNSQNHSETTNVVRQTNVSHLLQVGNLERVLQGLLNGAFVNEQHRPTDLNTLLLQNLLFAILARISPHPSHILGSSLQAGVSLPSSPQAVYASSSTPQASEPSSLQAASVPRASASSSPQVASTSTFTSQTSASTSSQAADPTSQASQHVSISSPQASSLLSLQARSPPSLQPASVPASVPQASAPSSPQVASTSTSTSQTSASTSSQAADPTSQASQHVPISSPQASSLLSSQARSSPLRGGLSGPFQEGSSQPRRTGGTRDLSLDEGLQTRGSSSSGSHLTSNQIRTPLPIRQRGRRRRQQNDNPPPQTDIPKRLKKLLNLCIYNAVIQQWGIDEDEDEEEYQAAEASGVVVHDSHVALWRAPPPEDVMAEYEASIRNPQVDRPIPDIQLPNLIPDWDGGMVRLWNVHVLQKLAERLDAAIKAGDWDELIPGIEEAIEYSNPAYLSKSFEKKYYRFAGQYKEQRPINSGDQPGDDVALAHERCLAVPTLQDPAKQAAIQRLFLVFGPEGLQGDVSGKKRHTASLLMSDDESDPEKPHTSRDYIRLPACWRDQRITNALHYIDSKLPGIRRVRCPGNVARTRTPSTNPHHQPELPPCNSNNTIQGAKKGMPENFYSATFLRSLADRDRERLNVHPPLNWDPGNVFS